MMETLLQDLRYGFRMLVKNPGFTLIAVVTMALGIGANAAIFSVVNGVMLRSLPFKEPDRLMFVLETNARFSGPGIAASGLDYRDWKEQSRAFESMGARQPFSVNLTSTDHPERLQGERVTWDYFPTQGVAPVAGRLFSPDEDRPGSSDVILLSEGLWRRRFGGDPNIIGQAVPINGRSATVVGVMPNDYRPNVEFWMPLALNFENADRSMKNIQVIGRLAADVTREEAQAEMSAIAARLAEEYPQLNSGWGAAVIPFHQLIVSNIRPALMLLLAAVGFVLLIACVNVANLLLARAASREKEIAIRIAIGASRWRLIRQVLTESLLISVIGGAIGVLIAMWGTEFLIKLNPQGIPLAGAVTVDASVLGFTLLISILSGILFGLVPALQASKPSLNDTLKDAGRGGSSHSRGRRIRSTLVVLEVAVALVLLAGAGLLIKSFALLQDVNVGFNRERLLTMQVFLPPAQYPRPEDQTAFFNAAVERLSALAGVASVSAVSHLPLAGGGPQFIFSVEGRPLPAPSDAPLAHYRAITPGYFETMGVPLLKGRVFNQGDDQEAQQVVIINQKMADAMWPGEDAINKRLTVGVPLPDDTPEYATVVGVVGDVKFLTLSGETGMQMYQHVSQSPFLPQMFRAMSFVLRTESEPDGTVASARAVIASLDPTLPVSNVKTMDAIVSDSVAPFRFNTFLLGLFAAIAMVLTVVGVYGVMNYSVSQRTQEIGIRMALGAHPRQVRAMVLRQGMALSAAGLAVGLVAGFIVTRWMSSLLFGVSTTDPVIFAAVALTLASVACAACYIPARRATKVDPIVALRHE
jgi:putative ABC transport system permease protein